MDNTNFDSQSRQHLRVYQGFMKFILAAAIASAIILALMAIFLT